MYVIRDDGITTLHERTIHLSVDMFQNEALEGPEK